MERMVEDWPVNCGAPLDPEKVKAGFTWSAGRKQWVRPEERGAEVYWAPDGWWTFFGTPYHAGKAMVHHHI